MKIIRDKNIKRNNKYKEIEYELNDNGCWDCTSHHTKSMDGIEVI